MSLTRSLFLAIPLLCLGACGKQKLDGTAEALVQAAMKNDYAAFRALAHPDLVVAFPEGKLAGFSRTLALLGAYKGRSMTGIEAKTGEVRKGTYKLSFEKGDIELELTLTGDKLTGFNFTGETLKQVLRDTLANDFKVASFEFLDAAKQPKSSVYKAGEPVNFSLQVQGLQRGSEGMKLNVHLRVFDAGGQMIFEKPDFIQTALAVKPDDPPVATVTGELKLPGAGMYKLELKVRDLVGGKEVVHAQALSLEK